LARFFAQHGASCESDLTLEWSERQGVALMLREITDNLDHLWVNVSPFPVDPLLPGDVRGQAA